MAWELLSGGLPKVSAYVTGASPTPIEGVVLVTVDSLRADAVGGTDSSAPTVDSLGESGVRFENAFAAGNWTPFSFPSLLGPEPVFSRGPDIGVATPTLASVLSEHGITTAGFNAANGFLTSHWGYDEGFDEFETFTESDGSLYGRYLAAHPTVQGWLQFLSSPFRRLAGRLRGDDRPQFLDTSRLIEVEEAATSYVETVDGPFFLWIHYMDTHTPYVPAPRHLRQVTHDPTSTLRMIRAHLRTGLGREVNETALADLRDLYAATVHQVDASVARLLDVLDAAGRRDGTCVIVAGDHGEEFMEHGHLAHYPKLYEELIHVPLVVDHPAAKSRSVDGVVSLDVVPPTILDAFGLDQDAFEGTSVLPTVLGIGDPVDEPAVSVAVRGERITQQPIPRRLDEGSLLVSARDDRWTYVHHDDGDHELYDRRADPGESTNVWPGESDRPAVERLRTAAEERADRLLGASDGAADRDEPTPDDVERRLRALGYQ